MANSLIRLVIRDYVLTLDQVQWIVGVLSNEHSELRSLQLHMHTLSCDLFDLLATKLPRLYHLELCFHSLVSNDDGSPNYYYDPYTEKAQAFVTDMTDRRYPEWALRHLTVRPLYHRSER
ncbi:unnamed protein product [Cyclocybe aegerita]|uniref:Uncharacterized protein n=1 Tax=Cyclocybe aegerita TaxID=1973307 RepID=A0A8S0WFT5_CYCAE|nr:unnamed protein product [Cyclocybe aegerita]